MSPNSFYDTLSETEKFYWQQLAEIFAMVSPQKPEKGIRALIVRARKSSEANNTDLKAELESVLQGARERTLRRIQLLSQCQIKTDSKP